MKLKTSISILSITALSVLGANYFFLDSESSSENSELKQPSVAAKKIDLSQAADREISASETNTSVSTPLNPPQKTEQKQTSVEHALEQIASSNVGARIRGIELLARLSPSDVVAVIYDSLHRLEEEPNIEGMIVLGMMNLASANDVLTNEDLSYLYKAYTNKNIRGRAARILDFRGDSSLLQNYLADFKDKHLNEDAAEKLQSLRYLGNLESSQTVPYIKKFLDDKDEKVRHTAIVALSLSGKSSDLAVLDSFNLDPSQEVREVAAVAKRNLEYRGENEALPVEMMPRW